MNSPRVRAAALVVATILVPISVAAQPGPAPAKAPPEAGVQRLAEPQLAVAVAPDGRRYVCSGQNRAVRQWAADGSELPALQNAPGGWWVGYSPDGRLIAGCGLDRIIRIWDADTGRELRQLQGHTQIAWMAAFLPGGERLVSVGEDATIRLWDVATGVEVDQLIGHPGPVWCMTLSHDGRWLATGAADGTMRLWDLPAAKMVRKLDGVHAGGVGALAFSPDGRTLVSTGWQDQKLLLWETGTGHLRRQVPHDGGSKFVQFVPDGRTLMTAGNDRTIRFWNLSDGKQERALEGHTGAVNGVALMPGGHALVSVSNDQTVRTWTLTVRESVAKSCVLASRRVEGCWCALARPDSRGAFEAISALVAAPEQALELFAARLRPAQSPNDQRIAQLIADTGNAKYAAREKASHELEKLGEEAEGALRRALATTTSAETRRRCERVLQRLEAGGTNPETLRGLRAVEVLERVGTPAARAMLQSLAGGTPEARLTVEAQRSLKRLKETVALR